MSVDEEPEEWAKDTAPPEEEEEEEEGRSPCRGRMSAFLLESGAN